jgi:hypothetical protein
MGVVEELLDPAVLDTFGMELEGEEVGVELIEEELEKESGEGLLDRAVLDFFATWLDLDSFGMRLECDGEEAGVWLVEPDSAVLDSFRVVLDVEGTVYGVELQFVNPGLISRLSAKHVSSHYLFSLKLTLKGHTISISMLHMGLKRGINCSQNKYHE